MPPEEAKVLELRVPISPAVKTRSQAVVEALSLSLVLRVFRAIDAPHSVANVASVFGNHLVEQKLSVYVQSPSDGQSSENITSCPLCEDHKSSFFLKACQPYATSFGFPNR